MFIYFSKLLPLFVYPVGLTCILILAGLFAWRRPKVQRILLIGALAVLFLGGNHWVALALTRSLEWQYLPPDPVPQAEVLVLLGGGSEGAEYPRPMAEFNSAGNRILYAAKLYKEGKAAHILVSGGLLDWSPGATTPAQDMQTLLKELGVPADAIWLEDKSRNTSENALYSAQILREKGKSRILLVTSAWHMPRSVRLFEAQGLEVIPAPSDYHVTQLAWEQLWRPNFGAQLLNLFPTPENIQLTTAALKEYIGMAVYSLRGWK
jgi:uncharacterized SAM-binding protein YcdF (DUF218 family)